MSQLVETGQGVAEFPDEMSHDEIAGVIKKQFYSAGNPPPAEISANDAKLQELGVDTAKPEDSFDPTSKPAQVLTGIAKGVGKLIPKSVGEAARMLTYTPAEETPHVLKEAYDALRGVPTKEAVPESQTLTGFLEKSLGEQSQILTEQLAPLAIGVAGLRGAVRTRPTLSEKLAPISKEAPPVQPQGQAEPVGVTEALAELKRRNAVSPGEVEFKSETPPPQTDASRAETGNASRVWDSMSREERWDFLKDNLNPADLALNRKQYYSLTDKSWQPNAPEWLTNRLTSVTSKLTGGGSLTESVPAEIRDAVGDKSDNVSMAASGINNPPGQTFNIRGDQIGVGDIVNYGTIGGTGKAEVISIEPYGSTVSYKTEHAVKVRNPDGTILELRPSEHYGISLSESKARPVPEAGEAPVESGLQAKPELPENTEVTIKASTSKGEPLEVKMDAREAEKVLNERKTALENLIDCLG